MIRKPALHTERAERLFLVVGLALLSSWAGMRLFSIGASTSAIAKFEANERSATNFQADSSSQPDFRLWSSGRIAAYRLSNLAATPLAILRIQKIGLVAPIFDGTDDLTLDRGVGRIDGTAKPGQPGNLGLAAHRDSFFRNLGNLSIGDILEVDRPGHVDRYLITATQIVTPDDVSVLKPTPRPAVTLVTCFPFYYLGHAPKRYIVTAMLDAPRQSEFAENRNHISPATSHSP